MLLAIRPPLKASSCTRRRGLRNTTGSLVGPPPLKERLFVVNCPQGLDSHHRPVPQSTSPLGYCPFNTRFGLARSSNVIVCGGDPSGVDVAAGVEVRVVSVAVGLPGVGVGLTGVDVEDADAVAVGTLP
jgi:hypothetical protein